MTSFLGMTRIILNPRVIRATLNPNANPAPNILATAANQPHIIVDKINDLFCVSSFHSPWFPNYHFSGGTAYAHPALWVSR